MWTGDLDVVEVSDAPDAADALDAARARSPGLGDLVGLTEVRREPAAGTVRKELSVEGSDSFCEVFVAPPAGEVLLACCKLNTRETSQRKRVYVLLVFFVMRASKGNQVSILVPASQFTKHYQRNSQFHVLKQPKGQNCRLR